MKTDPMKHYLITYHCRKFGTGESGSFHYDIVDDIPAWVDEMQKYDGEEYVLINQLEISEENASRWDGDLASM